MPDMLVRLYDLPDAGRYFQQAARAVIGGVGPARFYEKVCGAFVIPGSDVGIYGPLLELMQGRQR